MEVIKIDPTRATKAVDIGQAGENEAAEIQFDISAWVDGYGAGDVYLYHQREDDEAPYLKLLPVENNIATWVLDDIDTSVAGVGAAQLNYVVSDKIKKTLIFATYVNKSLGEAGDTPDPYEDLLEQARAILSDTNAAKNAAQASAADAEEAAEDVQEALEAITEHSGSYSIRKSLYTTTQASETTIPIGINNFSSSLDTLVVYINGLALNENEYTISGTNIVLTTPITTVGTKIQFIAYRGEVTVDPTLSISGAAADAKVTGDEITGLKSTSQYLKKGYDLLSYAIVKNSHPNAQGGFSPFNGWDRTDYIPVKEGRKIYFVNTYQTSDNAWYDESKNLISRFTIPVGNPSSITVPANAKYMIVSNEASHFFSAIYSVTDSNYTMVVEFGDQACEPIAFGNGVFYLTSSPVDLDNPVADANFRGTFIECTEGDRFYVNVVGGSSPRAYGWLDEDKEILSVAESGVSFSGILTAPENAKYLVLNNRNAQLESYKNVPVYVDIDGLLTNAKAVNDRLNIFTLENALEGYALDISAGMLVQVATAGVTDFIPVVPNTTYTINKHLNSSYFGHVIYDSGKNVITCIPSNGSNLIIMTPENGAYIRLSYFLPTKDEVTFIYGGNLADLARTHTDPNRYVLKPNAIDYGGYSYVAFSSGCICKGKEYFASRFGKQHTTPASRSDYGKIGFIKKEGTYFTEPVFPALGYSDIDGELRDPNLCNSKTDTMFLSGFTAKQNNGITEYMSYIFELDSDLNVLGQKVFSPNGYLFWGNTLITPTGYLLHCAYVGNEMRLFRSTTPYTGDMSAVSFTGVFYASDKCNELTCCYWNDKLIMIGRNVSQNGSAILYESDNLEGIGTFTEHSLGIVIHAPAVQLVNDKDYLLVSGSFVVGSSRQPGVLLIDGEFNVVSSCVFDDKLTAALSGYNAMCMKSAEKFDAVYFQEMSETSTELYFKEIDINQFLNTAYYKYL